MREWVEENGRRGHRPRCHILCVHADRQGLGQDAVRDLRQLLSAGREVTVGAKRAVRQPEGEVIEPSARVVAEKHGKKLGLGVLERPPECRRLRPGTRPVRALRGALQYSKTWRHRARLRIRARKLFAVAASLEKAQVTQPFVNIAVYSVAPPVPVHFP